MEGYQKYLGKLIDELYAKKMKLVYCCDEIHQAMKRLEIHSVMKKEIKKEEIVHQTQIELETVDFEEVDDLIIKAQQLILTKDAKQPSKSSARVKSVELFTKKAIPKGSTSTKSLGRSASYKPKINKINPKLKKENNKSKEVMDNQRALQVETELFLKKLPEPYKKEFMLLLNDSKKYNKFVKRHVVKHKADTDREKLSFLEAVESIEIDQKPCYIKKMDYVDEIFEQFEYKSDTLPNNFKERLLDQIDFLKQNQRLEFLLTHSKFFRQYLIENEVDAKTYRLIHWQLTECLPVLLIDDEDS